MNRISHISGWRECASRLSKRESPATPRPDSAVRGYAQRCAGFTFNPLSAYFCSRADGGLPAQYRNCEQLRYHLGDWRTRWLYWVRVARPR
jgi:hypothetical protein